MIEGSPSVTDGTGSAGTPVNTTSPTATVAFVMLRGPIFTVAEFVAVMYPGARASTHTVTSHTFVKSGTSSPNGRALSPRAPLAYLSANPAIAFV